MSSIKTPKAAKGAQNEKKLLRMKNVAWNEKNYSKYEKLPSNLWTALAASPITFNAH